MFSAPSRLAHAHRRDLPSLSLLAVVVAAALQVPYASAAETTEANNKEQNLVVNATTDSASSTQETDYNVPVTRSATKMALTARDTPQSVSVISKQRMEDQQLQTLNDVMKNTTGISANAIDSERINYYSRGFLIDNYMHDGIPTTVDSIWNFGDAGSDTAIYERIEVVRGSTGLMNGAGEPSASVNMVRKHADSKEFVGNVSASYGRWDKQRYVADLSAPLTESGNVRARVVAGYQDNDSFLDRYNFNKKFLYGVVDADLTDSTTLSVGYDYQESHTKSPTWGGIPTWFADGSRIHTDRSFSVAPDWSYIDSRSRKVFATLKQNFDNGWQFTVNGSHAETDFDSQMMYLDGYPDIDTGLGMTGGVGWNKGTRRLHSVDAFTSGPYDLFGRQHELMAGVSYSMQNNHYASSWENISGSQVGSIYDWDGSFPYSNWPAFNDGADDTVHQKSAYTNPLYGVIWFFAISTLLVLVLHLV